MNLQHNALLSDVFAGFGLCVEFQHRGDRYAHVISLVDSSGDVSPLLESIEGSPTDDWPPSPPLQNLHLQELPDGRRVALLVGMAARSHWSASIETVPGQAALLFDLACRTSDPAAKLGNRYVRLTDAPLRLSVIGLDDIAIKHELQAVLITPASTPSPTLKTVRWKYQLLLNPEP